MLKEIKVGDTLYLVSHGIGRNVQVTKVGRKWFCIDKPSTERFSIETGKIDTKYAPYAVCWKTKDRYNSYIRKEDTWKKIRRWIDTKYGAPENLTENDIIKIANVLDISIDNSNTH